MAKNLEYRKCNAHEYNLRPCGPSELDAVRGCTRNHDAESNFIIDLG